MESYLKGLYDAGSLVCSIVAKHASTFKFRVSSFSHATSACVHAVSHDDVLKHSMSCVVEFLFHVTNLPMPFWLQGHRGSEITFSGMGVTCQRA